MSETARPDAVPRDTRARNESSNRKDGPHTTQAATTSGLHRSETNPFRLERRAREKAAAEQAAAAVNTSASTTTNNPAIRVPPKKIIYRDLQSARLALNNRDGNAKAGSIPDKSLTTTHLHDQQGQSEREARNHSLGITSPQQNEDVSRQLAIPDANHTEDDQVALSASADDLSIYSDDPAIVPVSSSPILDSHQRLPVYSLPGQGLHSPEWDSPSPPSPVARPLWVHNHTSASTDKSQPEGSTVDEIYKQYGAAGSLQVSQPHQLQHTQDNGLSDSVREVVKRYSKDFDRTTTYDDSQWQDEEETTDMNVANSAADRTSSDVLLSNGIQPTSSDNAMSVAVSTVPSLTQVNWQTRYTLGADRHIDTRANDRLPHFPGHPSPFRMDEHEGSAVYDETLSDEIVDHFRAEEETKQPDILTRSRIPHERNVSRNLRYASGLSEESYEEFPDDGVDVQKNRSTAESSSRPYAKRNHLPDINPWSASGLGAMDQSLSGFYNRPTIPPGCVGDDGVRIPIRDRDTPPIPQKSPKRAGQPESGGGLASSNQPRLFHDNDSLAGRDDDSDHGIPFSKRTGSSVAGMSDIGDNSNFDGINYGSTDRIAQHPAPLSGGTDGHRMRHLNGSPGPVLLPAGSDHRVNGYPLNSLRHPPRTPIIDRPSPLGSSHSNPFDSSPPEQLNPYERDPTRNSSQNPFIQDTVQNSSSSNTKPISGPRKWFNHPYSSSSHARPSQPSNALMASNSRPSTMWDDITRHANEDILLTDLASTDDCARDRANTALTTDSAPFGADGLAGGLGDFTPRYRDGSQRLEGHQWPYRKPTAAPKDPASRALYNDSTLESLDNRHQQRDFSTSGFSEAVAPGRPHMTPAPMLVVYTRQKEKIINNVVLCACTPLAFTLLLFALGTFDGPLRVCTKQKMTEFSCFHKRLAWLLFGIEALIAIIVVSIVFGLRAKHGH